MSEVVRSAPGRLETVREFINTHEVHGGSDHLATAESLREWFLAHDLLEPGGAVGPPDVAKAIEMREALRTMALANNGAAQIDDRVTRAVTEAAERAGLVLRVRPDAAVLLDAGAPGADGALGRLLAIVYEAMAQGSWRRLKACSNDTCRLAFYDHSRNHSSHWCSMTACGNQVKARSYRTRRRSGA